MQLEPATVTRRVKDISKDADQQVLKNLACCEYFPVQFDEFLNVKDTAQLVVLVETAFPDTKTK